MKIFRYALEALLLSLLFIFSKILPTPWASGFGGWVGRTLGPRLAASRKAMANLNAALPALTPAQAADTLSGMWDNLGRVMMEYPHLAHIARDRTEIIGADILERYKGKPTIIFAAHLGNWEIVPPAMLLQHNIVAHPLYRAPNNPFSDKLLHYTRTLGGKIAPIPKSKTGTRNIVKALQDNQFIGILIDQKYNEGMEAEFFTLPAMTSPAFIQLAQKFDCPLIPIRSERTQGANFKITVLPPLDIKDKSTEDIMAESHALLEQWITDKPEQWLWLHRRWKNLTPQKDTPA